jgi:hypothetical protein
MDSVKSAFALGIQATQILRFLLFAEMRSSQVAWNIVASAKRDQIWLWDRK